ncbi:unnamed protein product, partial [Choristocarpus tenellus]
ALLTQGGQAGDTSYRTATSIRSRVLGFANKRFFLLGAAVAVSVAKLLPWLGATGGPLRPEYTVNKVGIALIFFLIGLSIRLRDLASAAVNVRLNLFIFIFSLGVLPFVGWLLAAGLRTAGFHSALATGVLILVRKNGLGR